MIEYARNVRYLWIVVNSMDNINRTWTQEPLEDYLKGMKSLFDTMTPLEIEVLLYGCWRASEDGDIPLTLKHH